MMKLLKGVLLLLMMLIPTLQMDAKKQKVVEEALVYEIEGAGTGTQGTYLVNVTVTTSDRNVADKQLAKAAVHGVLFRGFSSKEGRQSQRPLAGSAVAEQEHSDYFAEFFSPQGAYINYAQVNPTRTVTKQGKDYKVSALVSVRKDQLERDLGKAGVIRTLNSAF